MGNLLAALQAGHWLLKVGVRSPCRGCRQADVVAQGITRRFHLFDRLRPPLPHRPSTIIHPKLLEGQVLIGILGFRERMLLQDHAKCPELTEMLLACSVPREPPSRFHQGLLLPAALEPLFEQVLQIFRSVDGHIVAQADQISVLSKEVRILMGQSLSSGVTLNPFIILDPLD